MVKICNRFLIWRPSVPTASAVWLHKLWSLGNLNRLLPLYFRPCKSPIHLCTSNFRFFMFLSLYALLSLFILCTKGFMVVFSVPRASLYGPLPWAWTTVRSYSNRVRQLAAKRSYTLTEWTNRPAYSSVHRGTVLSWLTATSPNLVVNFERNLRL
jgi:hypothetical protein